MPRCEQCPVRAGLTCVGERHGPVCREVAAGRRERVDQLVAIAEGRDYEPPAAEYPSLARQAANLAGAVAAHALDGGRHALPEVQAERLAICRACQFFDAEAARCRKCGCGPLKLLWGSSTCPDDPPRWGPA